MNECTGAVSLQKAVPDGFKCIDAARPLLSGTDVNRSSLQNHGGITIIHRRQIEFTRCPLDLPTTTFENLCCYATASGKRFLLLCVYRPGSEAVSSVFFDEFTAVLEQLLLLRYPVILCGDFNIHVYDPGDWAAKRFHQLLESRADNVSNVKVGDLMSDHRLITFKLDVRRPCLISDWVSCCQWNKLSLPEFANDLCVSRLVSNPEQLADLSADELADLFNREMSEFFDKHCLVIRRCRKCGLLTPWFDSECRASRRRSRMLERRYRRSQTDSDRLAWIQQVKAMRQLYEQKSQHHWQTLIADNKGDAKKLRRTFDSILRTSKGTMTTKSNTHTADVFARFFQQKVDKVRAATASSPPPPTASIATEFLEAWTEIQCDEVVKLISQAPNKTSQLDPVPTWIVKEFSSLLAPFITLLFSKSLDSGQYPQSFKHAVVLPSLKKENMDPTQLSNYRPVSNLPFLPKLLEKLLQRG